MKKILFYISCLFFLSCGHSIKGLSKEAGEEYKIDKYLINRIHQLNDSIFAIYATRHDTIFKIVSTTYPNLKCDKIKPGKYYRLTLYSLFKVGFGQVESQENHEIMKQNLSGVSYRGINIMLERDSINDIYVSPNLIGLCYKQQ